MAKKRFKDGLDSLFGDSDQQDRDSLSLFPGIERSAAARQAEDKKSNKGFASQLDAFLAEAFENEPPAEAATEQARKEQPKKRLAGLDLLIRQTTDAPPGKSRPVSDKRRLTLAFDKRQLTKLKEIAEREGIFLKDLINQLIERYLQEVGR